MTKIQIPVDIRSFQSLLRRLMAPLGHTVTTLVAADLSADGRVRLWFEPGGGLLGARARMSRGRPEHLPWRRIYRDVEVRLLSGWQTIGEEEYAAAGLDSPDVYDDALQWDLALAK